MKTTISAKKMQVPQNFTESAEQRIDTRLGKFFGDEADAKIVLSEVKNKIVLELTVKYNSMIFRSQRSAEDKNVALDDAIDKIIRQIRKNKTKVEKKLKDTAFKDAFAEPVDEVPDYEV
ncbi:MAG: ribosome-associated translation inhibitor RaiA, partial [Ruminococcus sp.]|nr:ribosome-associated translation inhibitor RaiA [Ruminococcus sp.]